ncbi:glycosyltransferase family 4 protein [Aerococcaceae bacterium DSM 111176]|nr:glycosyltransferase family 4 protein [Aerococcaceae bacterium DSM 111176]
MNILYVTTISNTVNAFLVPHIEMLVNQGHSVDVACKIVQEVDPTLRDLGCQVHELPFSREVMKNDFKGLIGGLRQTVIDHGYDVVHTHTPIASVVARMACRNLEGVKVIYTAHGFHFYKGAPLLNWAVYYPVEMILSRYTDVLVTINQEDFERSGKFYAGETRLINGVGIDLEVDEVDAWELDGLRGDLGIVEDDLVLISVGELNQNKNHEIVIKAVKELGDPSVKYLIVGEGELKDYLEGLVAEYGLQDQVSLLGYRDDVDRLLQVSDVFVFPSFREGLSRALMESMKHGKPCVVSDIRGNRDLIVDGSGGLLVANDVGEYVEAVRKLLDGDLRARFGEFNRERIKEFSLDKVLGQLGEVYRAVGGE